MKTYPLLSILVIVAITAMPGGGFNKQHNLPPAQQMMQPGPGVGGPGPSVMMPAMAQAPPQAMAAPAAIVSTNLQQRFHRTVEPCWHFGDRIIPTTDTNPMRGLAVRFR